MKKWTTLLLTLTFASLLLACGKNKQFAITITVPAGSTGNYVYSDEEISPLKNKIRISPGEGLADTRVLLKPVEVTEENVYEPVELTSGNTVELDVEKGAWFRVGIASQNTTDTDLTCTVKIDGIDVRIASGTIEDEAVSNETAMRGIITEFEGESMIATPIEGSLELRSSDRFTVPIEHMEASPEPQIGDCVEITYDGSIEETYPAMLGTVYAIRVVADED